MNLVRADLSTLDLSRADFVEANLRMAVLSRADLRDARLTGCFLSGAVLNEVNLVGANLVEASLIGATLIGSDLSRADLSGADLTGANLQCAELAGAYLVGTFLNETDLTGANLSNAYVRMAQMAGANLSGAMLEGVDLSYTDLSGVRLDGSCLQGANLTGANLSASTLTRANLRGAILSGATLRGCNLTGAKLRDIQFAGVKLDDAWADWVDLGIDDHNEDRALLEEAFVGIIGKPMAQVLIEGRISDEVWAVMLAHLCEFQITHPSQADVRLKGIHQGLSSSALYLEAENVMSLAAYLAEFADIIGKGSVELFERLAAAVADSKERGNGHPSPSASVTTAPLTPASPSEFNHPLQELAARVELLQHTNFWTSDKALLVLTGHRQIWLEATSNPTLTLRPPHGATLGIDLIRGHFITDDLRRNRATVSSR
ncbi:MAG TPA: pentapeptide repeat-containing protein [Blastocatellia bacterium]|nr:pentapeptide repeat-containing protein [Blastocatellia bacterium]